MTHAAVVEETLVEETGGEQEEPTTETVEELSSLFDEGAGLASSDDKPSLESFAFGSADTHDAPPLEVEDRPKRKYTRRRKLGPTVDPELEALFTEAGIGAVAASGLDGFFRVCAAPPMTPEERRHMEKVVAYYAQQRMPKEASKYQPEILLGMMLAFIVVPRLGPISEKTAPVWRPVFGGIWKGIRAGVSRVFRIFKRGDNAE